MRYVLQVNTGSFIRRAASSTEVVDKVSRCLDVLDVEKVIYGWSPDRNVNESLAKLLNARGAEQYIWLPVFSEVQSQNASEAFAGVSGGCGEAIHLCAGETFDFVCQSSARNIENALIAFDALSKGLDVDGVFIDRIRYASAANSVNALYGCWCERCQEIYRKAGADIARLKTLADNGSLAPFLPYSIENGDYHFSDADIEALFAAKRGVITHAVETLVREFSLRGMKTGIDTFAPIISDFVGQDSLVLGKLADFIKPMLYLRTHSPAGIPYEVNALGEGIEKRLSELWEADANSIDAAIRQARMLLDKGLCVAPGIDVNRVNGICDATPAYVLEFIDRCEELGCGCVTLSWDALNLPEETLTAIARR